MPKGVYKLCNNVGGRGQAWPDDVIETLKREIALGSSAGKVVDALRQQHRYITTRNAVIGKAARMGCVFKTTMRNGRRVNEALAERRTNDKRMKAAVVAEKKESKLLRKEGDRGPANPSVYKRKHKPEDIERARQGFIPQVIEDAPATTKPFGNLKRHECRWPTAHDASMACGAPATIGSYCDKHASIAYRTMPTRKRNASITKVQDIDKGRANVLDQEAEATLQHFLEAPRLIFDGEFEAKASTVAKFGAAFLMSINGDDE